MCKIGVLAIGADLYQSAFRHFQTLVAAALSSYDGGAAAAAAMGEIDDDGRDLKSVAFDLLAHLVAMLTLVQTFRGRVNRQVAGRVTFPVLAVKLALQMESYSKIRLEEEDGGSLESTTKQVASLIKSAIFLIITAKLAFGKDVSYVARDEWFPRKKKKPASMAAAGADEGGVGEEDDVKGSAEAPRRDKKTK